MITNKLLHFIVQFTIFYKTSTFFLLPEAAQVSSEFANAMSETIGNHLKASQYWEALKEIITKDIEPIYENLQPH